MLLGPRSSSRYLQIVVYLLLTSGLAFGRGGGGHGHSSASSGHSSSSSSRSSSSHSSGSSVHVHGYTKKDGTYVPPHERSKADGNFSNNWSTKGNVNPVTGKPGTVVTPQGSGSSANHNSAIGPALTNRSSVAPLVPGAPLQPINAVDQATVGTGPTQRAAAAQFVPETAEDPAPSGSSDSPQTAGDVRSSPDRRTSTTRPSVSASPPIFLGASKITESNPQSHIDLENARYWIEHGHKSWAKGLLLRVTVDSPGTTEAMTAEKMLRDLK
jgi:hypothetical protein